MLGEMRGWEPFQELVVAKCQRSIRYRASNGASTFGLSVGTVCYTVDCCSTVFRVVFFSLPANLGYLICVY
jgi:hypothetical protein